MAALRSVCPTCRRIYGSEVRVCKTDGTPLVDEGTLPPSGSPSGSGPGPGSGLALDTVPPGSFGVGPPRSVGAGLAGAAPSDLDHLGLPPARSTSSLTRYPALADLAVAADPQGSPAPVVGPGSLVDPDAEARAHSSFAPLTSAPPRRPTAQTRDFPIPSVGKYPSRDLVPPASPKPPSRDLFPPPAGSKYPSSRTLPPPAGSKYPSTRDLVPPVSRFVPREGGLPGAKIPSSRDIVLPLTSKYPSSRDLPPPTSGRRHSSSGDLLSPAARVPSSGNLGRSVDSEGREHLGPYRLLRQLGEGGMARIYLAEHEKLGRICAIKRLHADHFADKLTVARFLAEARAVGAIHHPNLVQAYDVVEEPSEIYLVMEYLDGRDVAQLLRQEGPMSPERAADVMSQACDGLAAVHAQGIVHRDLKPENIFLTRLGDGTERVKLLDFGVARLLGDRPQELRTRSGLTVGTPTYMSPEQATASEIDARSDIYTIGVVLYEMLTGAPPFSGAGYGDVMLMHVNDAPQRLSQKRPDVPAWLDEIVMRCLEKEPAARFGSAIELATALRAAGRRASTIPPTRELRRTGRMNVHVEPAPKRPRAIVIGAAAALAVLVVVGLALPSRNPVGARPPDPGVELVVPAPLVPLPRPVARTVRVQSTPSSASVIVAGVEKCVTPCELSLPEGGDRVLVTVRAHGFLPDQRMVDPSDPPSELQLTLQPAQPLPAPGREGAGPGQDSPRRRGARTAP